MSPLSEADLRVSVYLRSNAKTFRHAPFKLPLRFKGRKPATAVTSERSKDSDTMARKASRSRANAADVRNIPFFR
jgi:hypothetical protein